MLVSYTAPDFPPQGCVALLLSSTSFVVMWSSPDPPNGIIANYTIVYRPVDAVADYDPSTLEGTTTNYTDANTTMLMAESLQSAVLYSIQLAATNQIGTSPFTQDLDCTVLTEDDGEYSGLLGSFICLLCHERSCVSDTYLCSCAVPGVPQSVNVISPSSTSLLVTWDHPLAPDRNGVITGYTVIRQSGSERDTEELFNNDTSHLLTGLVPFTDYNITVAGNTSAGQGEFTMPFIMRTLNDSEWRREVDSAFVGCTNEVCLGVCGFCTYGYVPIYAHTVCICRLHRDTSAWPCCFK